MSSPAVHQYLWRDYRLSFQEGWLITLTNDEAIAFIAFITTLVAYTQTRAWVILHYIVKRATTPSVHLEDSTHPAISISQSQSIRGLFFTRRNSQTESLYKVSPAFGVIAIINIVIFLGTGILLPWGLSGGAKTSVVLSKPRTGCLNYADFMQERLRVADLANGFFKQCWNNQTMSSASCDKLPISDFRPHLRVSRNVNCPFSGGLCAKGIEPVVLEHEILGPQHLGLNVASGPLVPYWQHRLTCAPLHLDKFIIPLPDAKKNLSVLNFADPRLGSTENSDFLKIMLQSLNGPNKLSDQKSGRLSIENNIKYAFDVMPSGATQERLMRSIIHPDLRREDAASFILALRLGRSQFPIPVDDPWFSAHDQDIRSGVFLPDHEISGIGCVEQFRFCDQDDEQHCNTWLLPDDWNTFSSSGEWRGLSKRLMMNTSVMQFLSVLQGTKALLSSASRGTEMQYEIDPKEQWVRELTAMYETSFLYARYLIYEGAHRPGRFGPASPMLKDQEDQLCHRLLFRDGSYTNIYFIWLLTSLAGLLLICLLSYSYTYEVVSAIRKSVLEIFGHCKVLFESFLCCKKCFWNENRQNRTLNRALNSSWWGTRTRQSDYSDDMDLNGFSVRL